MNDPAATLHHLTLLRLSMVQEGSRQDERQMVQVELQLPERSPVTLRLHPSDLRLPKSLTEARRRRYADDNFDLPDDRISQLKEILATRARGDEPLWLSLGSPVGTLPLVPWERLLAPRLGVRINRLSYFPMPAVANPGPVDVAVCASSPVAKVSIRPEVVQNVAERILESSPAGTTVHIFADVALFDDSSRRPSSPDRRVVWHDPRKAPPVVLHRSFEEGYDEDAEQVSDQHAWLDWMREALRPHGVDAVHFIGHGFLSSSQGMLALAESPTVNQDRETARFAGPKELTRFLTDVGAWVFGCTSVAPNFSRAGLRLLADQLARQRVGTVLLHEPMSDDTAALGRAYGELFGGVVGSSDASGGEVSIYCHPAQAGDVGLLEQANRMLAPFLVAPTAVAMPDLNLDAMPQWILSTQRSLESSVAQLLEARPSEHLKPAREGAERALAFIKTAVQNVRG